MNSVHLIGGGWSAEAAADVYGPFLAEAAASAPAGDRSSGPVIACVVLDEGGGADEFTRWAAALTGVAPCRPVPVLVEIGARFDPASLGDADGVLVCGGLTPAYADAMSPSAQAIAEWLAQGRPYAGFSAGSAIAAASAVVGGWLAEGVPICAEDAAEDLAEIGVVDGLGLSPFTVDVHCAQWGTLPRLIETIRRHPARIGAGIDEDTVLILRDGTATVRGRGSVWRVTAGGSPAGSVTVTPYRAGDTVPLP
jgi:cyanophycinase